MSWTKIDDRFADHPKVVGLSDRAFRLYVTALCYASRHETDGAIPASAPFLPGQRKAVKELQDAQLWDVGVGRTHVIHDYLEYNPTRVVLEGRRAVVHEARVRAGRAGGLATAQAKVQQNPSKQPSNEPANVLAPSYDFAGIGKQQNDSPVPVPVPVPVPSDSLTSSSSINSREKSTTSGPFSAAAAAEKDLQLRCITAYDGLMGSAATTPPVLKKIDEYVDDMQPTGYDAAEWFEAACQEAAENGAQSLKYVMTILKRWRRDGRGVDNRPGANGVGANTFVSAIAPGVVFKR